MKATEFLQAAIDVQSARAAEYDQPGGERSMGRTVQAFNAITGRDLTEAEGWLLLQVLKDVRQWSAKAYHPDSALDGVAYSSLKAEALAVQEWPEEDGAMHTQPATVVIRPYMPAEQWQNGDTLVGSSGRLYNFIELIDDKYARVLAGGQEDRALISCLTWKARR